MSGEAPPVTLRPERPADVARIAELTRLAFATHPHSSHTEEFILAGLRRADALTVSLVAESGGEVVGHIAVSPVAIGDGVAGWYGLGPMAVAPAHQHRGIGGHLVQAGLRALRDLGAGGCVVLGEPPFYARFGFRPCPNLRYAGAPPEYFLAQPFPGAGPLPAGDVRYHAAFDATA